MNFVISKNARTKEQKSEIGNEKNSRQNSMIDFSIYTAIEFKNLKDGWKQKDFQNKSGFRNREADRRNALDKYIYVSSLF